MSSQKKSLLLEQAIHIEKDHKVDQCFHFHRIFIAKHPIKVFTCDTYFFCKKRLCNIRPIFDPVPNFFIQRNHRVIGRETIHIDYLLRVDRSTRGIGCLVSCSLYQLRRKTQLKTLNVM